MLPIPPRIIAHVFTQKVYSADEIAKLQHRLAQVCEEHGRSLIDLIFDRGPIRQDPAHHISLRRIAQGDADGILIMQLPTTMTPRKSQDVLGRHLDGPLRFLNAAELAEHGLLPGGTRYAPHRSLTDAAHFARRLREAGLSLRAIASRLEEEGFRTSRGATWYPATVSQLLDHDPAQPDLSDATSPLA